MNVQVVRLGLFGVFGAVCMAVACVKPHDPPPVGPQPPKGDRVTRLGLTLSNSANANRQLRFRLHFDWGTMQLNTQGRYHDTNVQVTLGQSALSIRNAIVNQWDDDNNFLPSTCEVAAATNPTAVFHWTEVLPSAVIIHQMKSIEVLGANSMLPGGWESLANLSIGETATIHGLTITVSDANRLTPASSPVHKSRQSMAIQLRTATKLGLRMGRIKTGTAANAVKYSVRYSTPMSSNQTETVEIDVGDTDSDEEIATKVHGAFHAASGGPPVEHDSCSTVVFGDGTANWDIHSFSVQVGSGPVLTISSVNDPIEVIADEYWTTAVNQ